MPSRKSSAKKYFEKFVIRVESRFEAAHNLREYYGKPEPLHGHSWKVEAKIACSKLDKEDISVDYVRVKKALEALASRLDYGYINDIAPFNRVNPSSENIARWFYDGMKKSSILGRGKLEEIILWEGPSNHTVYSRADH